MSKIFIIFQIFALPSSATSPVYNGALLFHYSLRIGEMEESLRGVYVSAPIEMQAKYKVVLLWNHTVVCKPSALNGYRVVGVSFARGVEKGLRRDKYRLVKMSYLSRSKTGKTGKYRGNCKIRKKIEERLFLQISTLSKNKWTLPNNRQTSPIPLQGDILLQSYRVQT